MSDWLRAMDGMRQVEPLQRVSIRDGSIEPVYVVLVSSEQRATLASLGPLGARERWYHARWVERYNRRAARLGADPLAPLVGELGSWRGVAIVEDGA